MKMIADVKYGQHDMAYVDFLLPENDSFDLLIWFHGGGLEKGSRKNPRFAEDLVNGGMAVASVEYRMYPDAQFPDFLVDCADAVKYIMDHISEYGNANRIFVAGGSAGAYITLMLAFDKQYLANAGVNRDGIAAFISDSAQITTHFNVLRERGVDTRLERIDPAAAIYHLSPESDFRHLLLICYENDMPCRPEQNRLFFKSIQRLCPDQHTEFVQLPGGHCRGSVKRNEKGTFDFNDVLLDFITRV